MVEQKMLSIAMGVSDFGGIVGSFCDQKRAIKESHHKVKKKIKSIGIDT